MNSLHGLCGQKFIATPPPRPPRAQQQARSVQHRRAAQPVCLAHSLNKSLEMVSYVSHYLREQVNLPFGGGRGGVQQGN